MPITPAQVQRITEAHALGLLDCAIAEHASVSLSTVKRVRKQLGLQTHCQTTLRGRLGERIVAEQARGRGLKVEWRRYDNDKYDLIVQGRRVDAKAAMQMKDGTWKFRLPETRRSFHGQYSYQKDYAADCDVVVLVCLYPDERAPGVYLFGSAGLPGTVRIYQRVTYEAARENWTLLASPMLLGLAA